MTLGRKEAPLEKQQGGRTLAVFIMAVVLEGDVGRSGGDEEHDTLSEEADRVGT